MSPVNYSDSDSDINKSSLAGKVIIENLRKEKKYIQASRKHVHAINTPQTPLLNSERLKTGFAGVHLFFLITDPKHRLWVLVRTASMKRF